MFKSTSSKNEVNSVHLRSKPPKSTFLILINHKPTIINDEITYEPNTTQNNKIITSKYTLLNFLPKSLFVQFKRIGNFYFLMTTIIQLCIDSPVSPATSLVPLFFVVCITGIKQAYEDWLRHKSDKLINSRLLPLVSQNQKLIKIKSQDIRLGDIIQVNDEEEIPCDLILLSSSHLEGVCSITTANLDGETNLKKKFSVILTRNYKTVSDLSKLSGYIECEEPNSDLYEFSGILSINDSKENLKADNLLLRGSRLINTNYIFGIAVYTGKLTKMSLNSKFISIKFSSLEKSINNYLGIFLILLLAFCLLCLFLRYQIIFNSENILNEHWYLKNVFFPYTKLNSQSLTYNFLNFFVLFNYLIPISLYVSLEMTRFFGSKLMVLNKSFEKETKDDVLICNCSDINEELGQVKYLFSDKTGTLTQNIMKFVACSINGKKYIIKNKSLYKLIDGIEIKIENFNQEINFFFVCLALCNTVSVKTNKNSKQINFEYIADSSDEKALVDVAAELKIKLISSNENEYKILVDDKIKTFNKIKIIEFDSIRKRMSVIVKDEDDKIILVCKGADSEIINLIENGKTKDICNDIDDFAMQGLRTLTIAYRCLTEEELNHYFQLNQIALTDLKNKKQKLEIANSFIEDKLNLLGATGIEDKLQEDVEETLLALRKAGIFIWLLTGDKLETAISVAFSCKLIEPEFNLMFLSKQKDSLTCKETLIKFWLGIKSSINLDKKTDNTIDTNFERTKKNLNKILETAELLVEKLKNFIKENIDLEDINYNKANLECIEKIEEKISSLLKLEKALQESENYSKEKKKSFVKKLGLKKINIQAYRILDELNCIETYLETNDLTKLSKNNIRYKSSSSLNETNEFFSMKDSDIDFETFNTEREIKNFKNVSKLLKEKFVLILDGRSLHIAMKYHFPLFELVCLHCVVVICCRMSPIQKARMVKMIKNSPSKPVTAAIGDGANDVSMIQEANVGFGLIGKEGIQAVRNSDFAFSKFKFVKTVLLIHGHYFYVRMTQLVHFFFFKSLLFIIPQFIYSFYSMFSGQTIYHGMLLMTYNLLFTATPIFFHSLQDEHIPKMFLKEFPKLYKTISENSLMSLSFIIKWMTFSTIQGIFIFYSVKFLWPGTISMLDDGKEIGIFSFGLIIYHIIVLVVNIKILIMTRVWEKNFIISFVTSILILPIFCIIYSSFKWNFLDDGMFGQYNQLFKSCSFWITVFSITFFSTLPDIFYSVLETSIRLKFFKKLILKKN